MENAAPTKIGKTSEKNVDHCFLLTFPYWENKKVLFRAVSCNLFELTKLNDGS